MKETVIRSVGYSVFVFSVLAACAGFSTWLPIPGWALVSMPATLLVAVGLGCGLAGKTFVWYEKYAIFGSLVASFSAALHLRYGMGWFWALSFASSAVFPSIMLGNRQGLKTVKEMLATKNSPLGQCWDFLFHPTPAQELQRDSVVVDAAIGIVLVCAVALVTLFPWVGAFAGITALVLLVEPAAYWLDYETWHRAAVMTCSVLALCAVLALRGSGFTSRKKQWKA
jgi:hypothetical protein